MSPCSYWPKHCPDSPAPGLIAFSTCFLEALWSKKGRSSLGERGSRCGGQLLPIIQALIYFYSKIFIMLQETENTEVLIVAAPLPWLLWQPCAWPLCLLGPGIPRKARVSAGREELIPFPCPQLEVVFFGCHRRYLRPSEPGKAAQPIHSPTWPRCRHFPGLLTLPPQPCAMLIKKSESLRRLLSSAQSWFLHGHARMWPEDYIIRRLLLCLHFESVISMWQSHPGKRQASIALLSLSSFLHSANSQL